MSVKPFTKFQKDLDQFIKVYDSFIIDGNIDDNLVVMDENDKLVIPSMSLVDYIKAKYEDDYVVVTYDSDRSDGKRFEILNEEQNGLFSGETIHYLSLFGFQLFGPDDYQDNANDQETPVDYQNYNEEANYDNALPEDGEGGLTETLDAPLEARNVNSREDDAYREEIEKNYSFDHANDGVSLDVARMMDFIENARGEKPFMFIFKNTSRMGIVPGSSQNADERLMYNAIYHLMQQLNGDKVILLTNKTNDIPAWLENENYNIDVKKLTIIKPDEGQRKAILDSRLSDDMYQSNYLQSLDTKKQEQLNSLLAGFPIKKIERFFTYCIENDNALFDGTGTSATPISPEKAVLMFNFGTNADNPWDGDTVFDRVKNIKTDIDNHLKGQEHVSTRIQEILGLAVTGFKRVSNPHAPRAVLFLAGPTGTGKTEVTKLIAKTIFGSEEKMTRFDMSEFSQEHTDQRLFGAPPGYVGFDAGGELTNAVSQNPFSLILFDEIEKAHPRILDKFLQILSDGRLTDGQGKTVNFENTVIVLTSNAGLSVRTTQERGSDNRIHEVVPAELQKDFKDNNVVYHLANLDALIGVEKGLDLSEGGVSMKTKDDYYEHLTRFVKSNLSFFFANELNRREIYGRLIDSIVVYNYISEEAMTSIIEKEMGKIERYALERYGLEITEDDNYRSVRNYIINMCNTKETRGLGGRGINKKVDELYSGAISQIVLTNAMKPRIDEQYVIPLFVSLDERNNIVVSLDADGIPQAPVQREVEEMDNPPDEGRETIPETESNIEEPIEESEPTVNVDKGMDEPDDGFGGDDAFLNDFIGNK